MSAILKIALGVVLLSLLIIFAHIFRSWLSSLLHSSVDPLLGIAQNTREDKSGFWYLLQSKASLEEENSVLRERARRADVIDVERRLLLDENFALKAQLHHTLVQGSSTLASIVARPPLSPYDVIVIDVGWREGVSLGDLVVSGSTALGTVTEIDESESKVVLYSTPGILTPVIVGASSTAVTASGRGGGNFIIRVPMHTQIIEQDVVSLPSTVPLVIGVVDRVEESAQDTAYILLIRSPINIEQQKWVQVMTGNR